MHNKLYIYTVEMVEKRARLLLANLRVYFISPHQRKMAERSLLVEYLLFI